MDSERSVQHFVVELEAICDFATHVNVRTERYDKESNVPILRHTHGNGLIMGELVSDGPRDHDGFFVVEVRFGWLELKKP